MKKTLITLAALAAMTAQTMAADVTTNGSELGNGTNWTVGVGVKDADGNDTTFAQGDNVTVNNDFGVNLGENITVGTLNVNKLINLRPSGEYALTVSGVVNVNSGGSYNLYMDHEAKIDMNGGTMNVGGYWSTGSTSGNESVTVTVKGGWLDGLDSVINVNRASTLTISSLDDAKMVGNFNAYAGSTIDVDCNVNLGDGNWQDSTAYSGVVTLQNGSSLTGTGTLTFREGKVSAVGTNNTVTATLKTDYDLNLDVADGGNLTIEGTISKGGSEKVMKSGEGTLILADTAVIDSALTMNINAGALDLSEVTTLGTLNMANSTTLILGDSPITLTGALTMGQDITIDLSAWCSNTGENGKPAFDPYMTIFSYAADSGLTFSDALNGLHVTLIVDGFTNTEAWLTVADGGKSLQLVPEPTTATLSLLALAGLATRRRRK